MESEIWRYTRIGTFCSAECAYASAASVELGVFIFMVAFSPFLMIIAGPGGAAASLLLLVTLGLPALFCAVRGMTHRQSVPRDSRRNKAPLDAALLRTVSAAVSCPRCDGNLDLRSIGEDRVYVCGYCGATGTISVIDKSKPRGV